MKAYIVWYEELGYEVTIPIDENDNLLWDKSDLDQIKDYELQLFGNERCDDYFQRHEYSRKEGIDLAQQLIESDIQEKIWEPEEIQVLTVYPKTAEDYLSEKSLDELETAFFEQFNSTKYVSELFELIPEDVLYGWLIEQFEKEFTLQELKEVFEDE